MRRRSSRGPGEGVVRLAALASAAVLAIFVLAACETADPDAEFRDGVYATAYSHVRSDGWRPYLQLRVRAGELDSICFNAVRSDGSMLLDTESYLEQYRLDTGVELATYLQSQIDAVLAAQGPRVTASPAAAEWSVAFLRLAETVVDAARVGLTTDAAGITLLPTEEPYYAADTPDELGWQAELLAVYQADRVAAAHYQESRRGADGSVRIKRADDAYQADYEALIGIRSAQAEDALIAALVDGGSPDALSGATLTAGRFTRLAERVHTGRDAAELPDRLCR